jgi:hypothetical protein
MSGMAFSSGIDGEVNLVEGDTFGDNVNVSLTPRSNDSVGTDRNDGGAQVECWCVLSSQVHMDHVLTLYLADPLWVC